MRQSDNDETYMWSNGGYVVSRGLTRAMAEYDDGANAGIIKL